MNEMSVDSLAVKKFEDYGVVNYKVANQWDVLVSDQEISNTVRPIISSSWKRCLSANIDPLRKTANEPISGINLEENLEKNNFLLQVSLPYMKNLFKHFNDSFSLVMLADSNGMTLHGEASLETWKKVEKINFIPGTDWSETTVGTNAIGTAIIDNQPAQVFANEHFCQGWHHLICSAAPIRDPLTNQVLGVIDLTGEKNLVHAHDLITVINQAKKIENEIRLHAQKQNIILFEQILDVIGTPVIVFDNDGFVRKRNKIGVNLFNVKDSLKQLLGKNTFKEFMKNSFSETICFYKGKRWKVKLHAYKLGQTLLGGFALFEEDKIIQTQSIDKPTPKSVLNINSNRYTFNSIITKDPEMLNTIEKAKKAATMEQDLLITGESGVGKEVLVQAIHAASTRADQPFVPLNCGALPQNLLASELFGHKPGAFTGADPNGKKGKFVYANNGTLFLDEIGELPLDAQAYLLRVLEERQVIPLGGNKPISINVRIVAATNKNLEQEVKEGRFRKDLFYRINVLHLNIPPLRKRREDIELLVNHFLFQKVNNMSVSVNHDALKALKNYHWPGNIRQLNHLLDQALLNDNDHEIGVDDLPEVLFDLDEEKNTMSPKKPIVTKQTLQSTLSHSGYNIAQTARLLQVSRTTIYNKIKEYDIKW